MSPLIWNIVLLVFIQRTLCASDSITPQGDKQSGSSFSDIAQRKIESGHVIFDDKKISREGSNAHNRGQLGFNERKEVEKRYDDQDTMRKGFDKGRHSLGESEAIDQGKNSFERHGGEYYKKGHRRTGFSNNYHKDESGNNSSFYDDTDNEGGHRSSGNSGGYYGQKSQDSFRDGAHDVSYTERDRAHQGTYDNRKNINDYHDYTGGYQNDLYKDNRRNYLQDEAGRYFDQNGKEIYYRKENSHPSIRYRNDYEPLYRDFRYDVDTLPRGYYKEDPYIIPRSRNYRYFPSRQRYSERESYYPYNGRYDRNYRDDLYDNEYLRNYRNKFNSGYYKF